MKHTGAPSPAATVARFLALWALLAGGAAAGDPAGRAASLAHTRIVGGVEAETGAWPWQVALVQPRGSGYRQFCGGSLVHPRWVLTAAHCVQNVSAGDIQVLAGTHELGEGGRRIDVKAIRSHRGYRPIENDIALLELARPAGVGEAVALPDAARSAAVAEPGATATAIGWGLLRPLRCERGEKAGAHECRPHGGGAGHYVDGLTGGPVDPSDVRTSRLMQVALPLVGEEACREAYPGEPVDGRTLCAGLEKGGKDSCQGDSGGPLVVRDGGEWVQVGVVSWGAGCAKPGRYGVYTNVGAFAEWVDETTGLALVATGDSGDSGDTGDSGDSGATGDTGDSGDSGDSGDAGRPPQGDRALLVGINRHADPAFDLQGAVNDARNMRDLLVGYLGFEAGQIRVLTDGEATREAILREARDWLVAGTRPDARALLYFAGHGYHQADQDGDEADGRDEALVPHDARLVSGAGEPPRFANLILDDEVGALFDDLADRQGYLIVDACHSGTITRTLSLAPDPRAVRTVALRLGARPAAGTRSARGGRQGFVERAGRLVAWTAVESHQLALEDLESQPRQGLFTGRFVRGIAEKAADRNGDGRIVHAELLDYVTEESESYCERQKALCAGGLAPVLEGPPDVLARDLVLGAVPDPAPAAVAESALGHANSAGVRLEILPSSRVRLGEAVTFRVHSERSGHLLLVDVNADETVTQLFPNKHSERAGVGAEIRAGRPVEIPSPYYGFRLRAAEPAGPGILFAVVTEDPVSLDDLAGADRGFEAVTGAPRWLLAIGERLREPLMDKDGAWTRPRRWSYARLDYEIVR